MKSKKIVALVAAAAMVLSMAACGSTDNSSSDAKDGSAAAETQKHLTVIHWLWQPTQHSRHMSM